MTDLQKIITIAKAKRYIDIPDNLSLRDATILSAYTDLVTLPEIANYYGLSRERVRQIVEKYKI
jgi:DNA-directed RNA polymerase sigma subunit (sigma70/sigma32)